MPKLDIAVNYNGEKYTAILNTYTNASNSLAMKALNNGAFVDYKTFSSFAKDSGHSGCRFLSDMMFSILFNQVMTRVNLFHKDRESITVDSEWQDMIDEPITVYTNRRAHIARNNHGGRVLDPTANHVSEYSVIIDVGAKYTGRYSLYSQAYNYKYSTLLNYLVFRHLSHLTEEHKSEFKRTVTYK